MPGIDGDRVIVQVNVAGDCLGRPAGYFLVIFQKIDHGGGAGQYFRDLLGQQEGAWLDFTFLEQGAQEPGLHIDRGRLRHLLVLAAARCRSQDNEANGGGCGSRALANSRRLP